MSPISVIFAKDWVEMPCILLSQELHSMDAIIMQIRMFVNCTFLMD